METINNENEMSDEIAKRDALIKRLKDALSGDAAKLRKALLGLVEDCEMLDQRLEEEIDGCYSIIPKYLDIMHDFRDRIKVAQAALTEPETTKESEVVDAWNDCI